MMDNMQLVTGVKVALKTLYVMAIAPIWFLINLIRRSTIRPKLLAGQKFVITGAGSGLGRLISTTLYNEHNCELILLDIDVNSLNSLKHELDSNDNNVHVYGCDLSDLHSLDALWNKICADHGRIDGLIHCAGIVNGKNFLDTDFHLAERVFNVNFLAVMKLTKLALPVLLESNQSSLVFISSLAGIQGCAGMADYSATKFAINGFAESLRIELPNLDISTVSPFFINTGMFSGIKPTLIPILDQTQVCGAIIEAIQYRKRFVVIPWYLGYFVWISKMMPRQCGESFQQAMNMPCIMQTFVGRSKSD